MRHVIAAAALSIAGASPGLAASRSAEDAEMARTAEKLNDPRLQSAVSGMMIAMADVVMDVRIDKLREAIARTDPESRNRNGDGRDSDDARTLGDVVERDDPNFRGRLADSSRMAVGTMGAIAGGIADMVPELRQMGERMGRDMEKAMRRLPRD